MVDSRRISGSRDDLLIDSSRCLRMRFNESRCRRCIDICPHGAVILDDGLSIDPELCRGCLLCTTVCPAGALEQSNDFFACLSQLSRVPEPILGCIHTKKCSNAAVACLGGLSEEHLLILCQLLSGELTLNLTACSNCPNKPMIPLLRQRLAALSGAGLTDTGCRTALAESAQDLHYHDESVDRRSFFRSFRNSLLKSAAVILSAGNKQTEQHTAYSQKRLPIRRELLNLTTGRLSPELRSLVLERYEHRIAISCSCTACQGCVAICPTGALLNDSPDAPPQFDSQRCTGCGLCAEFCLDDALSLDS